MKNYKIKTIHILLIGLGFTIFSCTKDFNAVNTDPLGKREVEAHQLMAQPLVNVLSANLSRNRSFNNELMQVTVDLGDSEGKVFRYDVRRTLADYTWNTWYVNLTDLKDIQTIASKPGSINKSYQGISLITQAWIYSLITDTYGDVPYSEANLGRDGIYQPKFDKQKDIYLDLFKKLEDANNLLKDGTQIVATSDPVYKGDINKWRRFGNALYLRLLLRVSGKAEVASTVIAKIKEIVDTNPANYPVIENNSQVARIVWNGTNVSNALFTSPLMQSVRPVDFRGPAICDFFIGRLVNWNDPRVSPSLGVNSVPRWGIAKGPDGYEGVVSGYNAGTNILKQAYFYSEGQNATTLQTDPNTGIIMNSAEVYFILAEAAAKGWIAGAPDTYYYKGMSEAISYWLPTYITGPTDSKFTKYVSDANLTWNNSLPLNSSTGNSKMAMIHAQKYYALFLVDLQQWFEYRRTGYPELPKGIGLANGGKMPARLNYPLVTQSTNPASYKDAVASQGPDDINTLVWWQKP